jgi:N-acetylglucosamine-6-phosphate deacetylase
MTLFTNALLPGTSGTTGQLGWLRVADGSIVATGSGPAPSTDGEPGVDVGGRRTLPGFVDVHCHGGGGSAIYSGDIDDVRTAARTHLEHGTTGMLASVASAALPTMLAAASAIADAIEDGTAPNLIGIHFEGPFLSDARRGAQTRTALLEPDEDVFARLMDAARGWARVMTVAPELPGATELIERHADQLVFALGHTDASGPEFAAGVDAGARHVTHLFNAMPPLEHRDPASVARALLDERVTVELIADGHHLADDTIRLAVDVASVDRVVLVTDAMAATGMGDGHYAFVNRVVDVRDGAAYLSGTDTMAGSTLLLERAARRMLTDFGFDLAQTSAMTSGNAARLLGATDRGSLTVGARADLVVLDESGATAAVYTAGERVVSAGA